MSAKNGKASLASDPLDKADRDALARVGATGPQDPAASTPTAAEDGQPSSAVSSAGSQMWAGHAATLANQFFRSKFGPAGAIPDTILSAIKADLAAAIDAYLPAIDARPGIFALVALGGHFVACAAQAKKEKPSASWDKAEPEKPLSSESSSGENREC